MGMFTGLITGILLTKILWFFKGKASADYFELESICVYYFQLYLSKSFLLCISHFCKKGKFYLSKYFIIWSKIYHQ